MNPAAIDTVTLKYGYPNAMTGYDTSLTIMQSLTFTTSMEFCKTAELTLLSCLACPGQPNQSTTKIVIHESTARQIKLMTKTKTPVVKSVNTVYLA